MSGFQEGGAIPSENLAGKFSRELIMSRWDRCVSREHTAGPNCLTGSVGGGRLADGWIVFSNRDRDPVVDAGADEVIQVFEPVPAGYNLTNLAGTIAVGEPVTYLPDGSSRRNLSLLVCPPSGDTVAPWAVVLNTVGRARATRGEGQCPAALI